MGKKYKSTLDEHWNRPKVINITKIPGKVNLKEAIKKWTTDKKESADSRSQSATG